MNHPLQKLDVIAREAVAYEIDNPQLQLAANDTVEKAGQKIVAGFSLHDESASSSKKVSMLEERRSEAKQYVKDADALKAELADIGVEPLGFAPSKAWDYICREVACFGCDSILMEKFKSSDCLTAMNSTWLVFPAWFVTTAIMVAIPVAAIALFSMYFPFMQIEWEDGGSTQFLSSAIAGGIAFVIAGLNAVEGGSIPYSLISVCERMFFRLRLMVMSHQSKLDMLMPDGKSLDYGFDVSVVLPEPPEDVCQTLLKLQSISEDIEVVAESDAIAFMPPLEKQVLADMKISQAERVEEARRRAAMRLDPIITVRKGSAVALVDQFGDFPIEEEVMQRGLSVEHLL